ncbi:MAG: cytidine deaminase [Candidatus Marinimicrobia bacterium]|nr:cytidine deaminase [Candidatus Neomarinimicrobiota bacterium]
MEKLTKQLIKTAKSAANNAHCPFSNYPVGAALLSKSGKIYKGCNVESSSYGLSVCAERNAIAAALVDNAQAFSALVIYSQNGATPCGACRQVIWDVCGEIPIYTVDENNNTKEYNSKNLLPEPFGAHKLE